jgi:fructoselysine-6-P-deglycase FrlB-like protein
MEYRDGAKPYWVAMMIVHAISSARMSEIVREIASQPDRWRRAAAAAREAATSLPSRGERVAVIGCGTSWFVAQAYASMREASGGGETDPFAASEAPDARSYDTVLAISRSGTTTEVVRFLERVPSTTRTVAICGVDDTPVASTSRDRVVLGFADERSVVQTRFATSALALLRASLGQDLEPIALDAERALDADLPIDPGAFDHFVFLGRGWTVGLANEAALKLREASGAWAESYPAMEYRHGPISVAGSRSAIWPIGEVETDLLLDVATTGAKVVDTSSDGLDPMAELILIQRTAVALAELRGLDPDRPRHLTRSVVLS